MADIEESKVKPRPNGSKDDVEADDEDIGTNVDVPPPNNTMDNNTAAFKMDIESPSSEELEKLVSEASENTESDNDSMASGHEGVYVVNPDTGKGDSEHSDPLGGTFTFDSTDSKAKDADHLKHEDTSTDNNSESSDVKEPAEKKLKSDRRYTDSFVIDKKSSRNEGGKLNDSLSESRPSSVASSSKSGTPGKDKDPVKREKERDREDRIRQAQVKLAEERQKKIDEMREQQKMAQENRERQLEVRRKKIEDLKKREEDRRKQVDERRKHQEEHDRARKESILSKAKERLTRYEQWKSHGRKGGRRTMLGFGSRAPREVCLPLESRRSSSQSTLRRSPNSSDYESYFNRRAVSASSVVRRHCCIDINKLTMGTGYPPGDSPPSKQLSVSMSTLYHKRSPQFSSTGTLNTAGGSGTGLKKSGAESMMALHAIPENRLGRSFVASHPPTRHKSSVNLGTAPVVKMRDPSKTSPRKPRPSSVATSMPSFVRVETDSPKSSRSKSTDRGPRETSRNRSAVNKDEDKTDGKVKAATLPRPYDRKKIEERRQEVKKKTEEKLEKEKENRERMTKSEIREDSKDKAPNTRMTKSFIERMSVPKRPSPNKPEPPAKESAQVKDMIAEEDEDQAADYPEDNACYTDDLDNTDHYNAYDDDDSYNSDSQHEEEAKPSKPTVDKSKMATKDSPSKSPVKVITDVKDTDVKVEVSHRDSPQSLSPAPSATPPPRDMPTIQVDEVKEDGSIETEVEKSRSPTPPSDQQVSEPSVHFAEPELTPKSPPRSKQEPKQATPEPKPATPKTADTKSTPKTDKEREMEEYKAKLAEKRRLAREKAEREAEIERIKQEELQRQQEEQERVEEERERREEEESLRLAAEARLQEEERFQKAIEAEEKRKKEEAERLEVEKLAREEADKKAKVESERLDKEREERARREEDERVERKKRLEMIMKRVKTDSPAGTPEKSRNESPTRVMTASSSRGSLVSSEDEKTDESEKDNKPDRLDVEDAPKFKSPLLQKLSESKQNIDSSTPKFKSPLLQSIMGKTKLGARLSSTRLDEMAKSDDDMSRSTESLSKSGDNLSDKESLSQDDEQTDKKDTIESSGFTNGVSKTCDIVVDNVLTDENVSSRSDVDSHEQGDSVISGDERVDIVSVGDSADDADIDSEDVDSQTDAHSEPEVSEHTLTGTDRMTDSQITVESLVDSAVCMTMSNGVTSTHNGDVHIEPQEHIDTKELVDSSISMRTADSFGSSQSGSNLGESLVESQTLTTSDCTQFEEIIDLNVTNNKTHLTQQITDSYLNNHSEDLLSNLNNYEPIDNSCMVGGGDSDSSHPLGKPIIAFEDNATRRQDVPDLLS